MNSNELTLGLDLGVTSIGWALADIDGQRIVAAGVRIFEAPMDIAKFEAGEPGGSHAATRRKNRMQRRQIRRRQARHRDLYIALQTVGMLPFAGKKAEDRHKQLIDLDVQLIEMWRPKIRSEAPGISDPDQVLCYYLRSKAASGKMELVELGRALYHLGQRRGFKSNRREGRSGLASAEAKKQESERSQIKSSIESLQSELDASGLTLGQRLAFVNPHQAAIRNRKRSDIAPIWTGRRMYQEEFERIWTTQAIHYPALLTDDFKNRVERLIFKQREVSTGKPGNCELERDRPQPRAPRSSLLAQHFRVVQAVNNLQIDDGSNKSKNDEGWKEKQRDLIVTLSTLIFERKGKRVQHPLFGIPFPELKTLLGLSKRAKLNLDDDEAESYLRGNRTNAIMNRAFGADRWNDLEEQEKRRIVRRWITEPSPEKLLRIAKTQWHLKDDAAEQLASLEPEEGYAALSHMAMLKLLPHMEQGLTYSEAVKKVYRNVLADGVEHEYLPPVEDERRRIPNPVVKRALTELRKVLNAIIREHGRPARIRIELARDLKRNAEQREKLHENIKVRTRERAAAKKWIEERGERASDPAIEKVLLYRRCKDCVYCTKPLGPCEALFSDSSGIEVEHVLPRRCNDNSFSNKVLAHRACNNRKGDRTPRQAWDPSPEWDEMLKLIKSLKDKALLERFTISTEEELRAFINRHLSDTRYISKLATEYVELLYGGRDAAIPWEDRNRRCVYASSGSLTAEIRKRWGLNAILNPSKEAGPGLKKSRDDHRHHAVDAIVIALTTESTIQRAAFEAQRHDRASGHLLPRYFSPLWPTLGDIDQRIRDFRNEIRQVVGAINVSHRAKHKMSGEMHDETNYSKPHKDGKSEVVHIRKGVAGLSVKDIDNIVDPEVRKAVKNKAEELGDLAACETRKEWPMLNDRPIRKVRMKKVLDVTTIGNGTSPRYVAESSNHHIGIYAQIDSQGKEKRWDGVIVSLMEAYQRVADLKHTEAWKQHHRITSIIQRSLPDADDLLFKFSLMGGDTVETQKDYTERGKLYRAGIYRVRTIAANGQLSLVRIEDARMKKVIKDAKEWWSPGVDGLRKLGCRKVVIDLLGNKRYAND